MALMTLKAKPGMGSTLALQTVKHLIMTFSTIKAVNRRHNRGMGRIRVNQRKGQ